MTDAAVTCRTCGEATVELDIRDQCTAGELAECFGTRALPLAYALVGDDAHDVLCHELEISDQSIHAGADMAPNPSIHIDAGVSR